MYREGTNKRENNVKSSFANLSKKVKEFTK